MLMPSMSRPTTISGIPGGVGGEGPDGVVGVGLSATLNWIAEDFGFPAVSYARTTTTWDPTVQCRVNVVCRPIDTNAAPSMLTSYRATPEPPSDPDQESESSAPMGTLGEFVRSAGGVVSTLMAIDFAGSE